MYAGSGSAPRKGVIYVQVETLPSKVLTTPLESEFWVVTGNSDG